MSVYRQLVYMTPEQVELQDLRRENAILRERLLDVDIIVRNMRRDHEAAVSAARTADVKFYTFIVFVLVVVGFACIVGSVSQ